MTKPITYTPSQHIRHVVAAEILDLRDAIAHDAPHDDDSAYLAQLAAERRIELIRHIREALES